MDYLRGVSIKLDPAARQRVYIFAMVEDGPSDRRIFNATGRPISGWSDFIYE